MTKENGKEEEKRLSSRKVKDVYKAMMKKAREERGKKNEEKRKNKTKMVERRKEKREDEKGRREQRQGRMDEWLGKQGKKGESVEIEERPDGRNGE